MAFPMIQFKATNTVLEGTLQDTVERKLASLERYIGSATDLRCEVEFEKIGTHQHGPVHRVEVNLYRDGQLFRAEATEESFENAIDRVRSQLDTEMKKSLKKRETMLKRGGRAIKDMLRFGK
jgi:ribosomal subunit interface protein